MRRSTLSIGWLPWLAAIALGVACAEQVTPPDEGLSGEEPPADLAVAVRADYALQPMPESDLWYRGSAIQSLDYPQDSAGVPLFEHAGTTSYHPVQIEWKALAFLDNHRTTGDEGYLGLAERLTDRLILEAVEIDSALFLPYRFDYDLHGIRGELMQSPWYSGMSQGLALSLLVRLHRATGDEKYLDQARRIFPSLLQPRRMRAWITRMDESDLFWIEEYPMDEPTKALNGFLFALLGVHEYWQATGDPRAETVLLAAIATLERHIMDYRVAGEPSYYCLAHRVQILTYHRIHIWQLHALARVSGSAVLTEAAETFTADAF